MILEIQNHTEPITRSLEVIPEMENEDTDEIIRRTAEATRETMLSTEENSPKRQPEPTHQMIGKRGLITGANSGIGRAAAIELASHGMKLALLGRTPGELAKIYEDLGGSEAGHHMLVADVADEEDMISAYARLSKEWGSLDCVVANAGINGVWAALDDISVDEWDETLSINLRGTFLTVKLGLPQLRKNGGSVIIISSINGTRVFSNSGATAYSCSKAAQIAFTKMTALELAKDRIRVNAICPGAIDTNIDDSTEERETADLHLPVEFPEGEVPLTDGKPGKAADVARVISFLASDDSSHISGTEIYVDGAQSLLQG